ncbi:preprotein translocase subunit SecG [bacterium (Candidatus Moisslbacteria) CG12_big_fil_rev_8_21_14_0_65_36_11]|nr:preprotein translocase subunit SecG [Candidatus Kuenenbacteria bacterium]OIP77332.1 MAG: preprotein translocase subunit SecG [Parcubacteria group bacterium CG2_30_36_38]PIW68180.1 MAG: preprotein translocase subunit SecG [bacterium (Candidatus Moisslbacteria) CG12_big_fil_rev_8_21_14_0_65_36_11]
MNILSIVQIVVSVLLIICVLFQARGGGLSSLFGGRGEVYQTRRGLEKTVFIATIVFATLFLLIGFLRILVR